MNRVVSAACLLLLSLSYSLSDSQKVVAALIDTVLIDNPGNAAIDINPTDTRWFKSGSFGSVSEEFRIGTTEVTNDQYVAFLSAVASTDTHALFNTSMASNSRGGILRTGTSGSYSYSSKQLMGNKPVNFVSFWDTLRFANWLHNGMPSGSQNTATTEEGAYTLGGITNPPDREMPRNPNAKWFLPNEDEWFKAAHHKNNGITGNYYEYPTATDDVPIKATADAFGNVSNPGSNVVNYGFGADWNGINGNVTTVGSTGSPSAYGTFDQAGNLDEWTETRIRCLSNASGGCNAGPGTETDFVVIPIVRGGTWAQENDFHIVGVQTGSRDVGGPTGSNHIIGFRVAAVAEPEPDILLSEWENGFGTLFDGEDFLTWQRQQVHTVVAVPEPSTFVFLSLASGILVVLFRNARESEAGEQH